MRTRPTLPDPAPLSRAAWLRGFAAGILAIVLLHVGLFILTRTDRRVSVGLPFWFYRSSWDYTRFRWVGFALDCGIAVAAGCALARWNALREWRIADRKAAATLNSPASPAKSG